MARAGLNGVLADLEKQRQRAEHWRQEATRLRVAGERGDDFRQRAELLERVIRKHHHDVTAAEIFDADEPLWNAVGIRTRCAKGHTLLDAIVRADGGRRCYTCKLEENRERRADRLAA